MKMTRFITKLSVSALLVIVLLCMHFLLFALPVGNNPEDPYAAIRDRMVLEQIERRGVTSAPVLNAMRNVKRHLFVPESHRALSYSDQPLPIGEGQTISQPYIVGLMTDVLDLKRSDKALEIGTGSGYQAAILAELCDSVYTIEIIEALGRRAETLFQNLGYTTIHVKIGDGYLGWKEHAPYDAIIVTCSPSHIPQPLKDQLAEGGRMIIPVGQFPAQELILLKKKKNRLIEHRVLPVLFVPMMDADGKKY